MFKEVKPPLGRSHRGCLEFAGLRLRGTQRSSSRVYTVQKSTDSGWTLEGFVETVHKGPTYLVLTNGPPNRYTRTETRIDSMAIKAYRILILFYSLVMSTGAVPSQEAQVKSTPIANKFFFAFGDSYVRPVTTLRQEGTKVSADEHWFQCNWRTALHRQPDRQPDFPWSYGLYSFLSPFILYLIMVFSCQACGLVNNWVDWTIATLNSTYITTYDFAYGGATIDANLVVPYLPTVKSLIDQVNDFSNYTAYGRPYYPSYRPDNSVWAFWIGINDIGNSWYQPGDRDA